MSPDYTGTGAFPLTLSRNYQSYRAPEVKRTPPDNSNNWTKYIQHQNYTGGLMPQQVNSSLKNVPPAGYAQWSHNYHHNLLVYSENTRAILRRSNGRELYFNSSDGVTFTSKFPTGSSLEKLGDNFIYTSPEGITETYNTAGQLTEITNQLGLSQLLTYNTEGRLTNVTDPAGRSLTFAYDASNRLSTVTDPSGQVITYAYGIHGNLISVDLPDNTPDDLTDNPNIVYAYNDDSHPYALTQQTDENGDVSSTWSYDEAGRATGSSNNGGHKTTNITYGENTVTVTEGNNQQRTLTFDNYGRLSSVTGGNCGQCGNSSIASYQYNNRNQLTSKADFNGNVTSYEYNDRNLQIKRTEAYGTGLARVTTTAWHSKFSLPTRVTTPTKQLDYFYNAKGRLDSITETDLVYSETPVRVTLYSYNDAGLLSSIDGPRTDVNDITTFTYDANHDLVSIVDAAGNETRITARNTNGYPTSIIDANGIVTTLRYDARNRLVSQAVNTVNITLYTYDKVGQLIQITLPSGATTKYAYNGARLLTAIEDGLGNAIHYSYDVMGNITKVDVKDVNNTLYATQQQVFDGLNRLTSQIDGLSQTTVYAYDSVGNQVSVKTPMLKETKQVYDALNRLSETIDAKNNKTYYSYDEANNLISVKAANGAITKYKYDGFGNLLLQTSPDTGTTTFTYDVSGNQISKTDAKGVVVNYSYDALNRLVAIDYSDNTLDVTLTYDTGDNGKGRLSKIIDGSGTTSYSYDALGNVSTKKTMISGNNFTINYAYNGASQLTQLILPSGRKVKLIRNAHGLITDITETKAGRSQTLLTGASYAPFGNAKSFILGNEKATTRTYNLNGQLASISVSDIYQSNIAYNSESNIIHLTSGINPNSNQNYSYDELERLTKSTGSYGILAYDYDSVGNRTTKRVNGTESSLNYVAQSNRLSSPFVHDANGNLTNDVKRSYGYGKHSRLTEVTNNEDGITTKYVYNGIGQRVQKQNVFGETYFLYDEQGLLIAEADNTGKVIKEYVYFEGQPLVMLVGE